MDKYIYKYDIVDEFERRGSVTKKVENIQNIFIENKESEVVKSSEEGGQPNMKMIIIL